MVRHSLALEDELGNFYDYFQYSPTDVEERDRVAGKSELTHLTAAFTCFGWTDVNHPINKFVTEWMFVQLGGYFRSVLGSREGHGMCTDWPSKLIVSTGDKKYHYTPQSGFHYTPRSGFHLSVDRLMYLLVEVQSDKDEGDRYRMLLQAACAARLGRTCYPDLPFIVVALYIENCGTVTRYFVVDGGDTKVSFVKDVQDWRQPIQLFTAIFELHNLASIILRDRDQLEEVPKRMQWLSSDISKYFKDTFTSAVYDSELESDSEDENGSW